MLWLVLYLVLGAAIAALEIRDELRSPGMLKIEDGDLDLVLMILIAIAFVFYCVFWPAVLLRIVRDWRAARREARRGLRS